MATMNGSATEIVIKSHLPESSRDPRNFSFCSEPFSLRKRGET